MRTVTVTIGRNVGSEPLPAEEWHMFAFETRQAVEAVTSELWATGPSKGSWDGVPEEARFYYGPLAEVDLSAGQPPLAWLRARLETLASKYHQDAIGLSVGESELVEAFATPRPDYDGLDPAADRLTAWRNRYLPAS